MCYIMVHFVETENIFFFSYDEKDDKGYMQKWVTVSSSIIHYFEYTFEQSDRPKSWVKYENLFCIRWTILPYYI